jgi:hypothetical protein
VSPDHLRRISICFGEVVEVFFELVKHSSGLARSLSRV